jgi:hypothetical protein
MQTCLVGHHDELSDESGDMTNLNHYWSVNYRSSERDSGDEVRNISMSCENRSTAEVRDNLNAFFRAIGIPLRVAEVEQK